MAQRDGNYIQTEQGKGLYNFQGDWFELKRFTQTNCPKDVTAKQWQLCLQEKLVSHSSFLKRQIENILNL